MRERRFRERRFKRTVSTEAFTAKQTDLSLYASLGVPESQCRAASECDVETPFLRNGFLETLPSETLFREFRTIGARCPLLPS
jgi:hypothetical protein